MRVNLHTKDKPCVYRYKICENIFGLVQVKVAFCIFFDIFFEHTDKAIKIDLNDINILHYRFIATQRLKNFFIREETNAQLYKYDNKDFLFLEYFYKSPKIYGANLSKLPKNLDMWPLEIIIADLSVDKHYDELIKYDLIGMTGEVDKIQERLKKYLETGIDFDKARNFIFPNLLPKPKGKLPQILSEKDLELLGFI